MKKNTEWENRIICIDCEKGVDLLPDESIDLVMTSPPYWGLRDYGVEEQVGIEKSPEEYVERLVRIFSKMKRALKPEGSAFVNLGDTYLGSMQGWRKAGKCRGPKSTDPRPTSILPVGKPPQSFTDKKTWKKQKQLALIPPRFAIAMQEAGWILRNDIIWHKPNGMPCAAKDRLSNRYEHVFHFTKDKYYYYDLDSIRVPYSEGSIERFQRGIKLVERSGRSITDRNKYSKVNASKCGMAGSLAEKSYANYKRKIASGDILKGKNPGDLWTINPQPFPEAHFAVYPEKLCLKPILAACPPGGVVLDPFCGAGTTCLVAKKLNRGYVGFEINPEYVTMAKRRLNQEVLSMA